MTVWVKPSKTSKAAISQSKEIQLSHQECCRQVLRWRDLALLCMAIKLSQLISSAIVSLWAHKSSRKLATWQYYLSWTLKTTAHPRTLTLLTTHSIKKKKVSQRRISIARRDLRRSLIHHHLGLTKSSWRRLNRALILQVILRVQSILSAIHRCLKSKKLPAPQRRPRNLLSSLE